MTLHELWRVSPQCFVFVRQKNGQLKEYAGGKKNADSVVKSILATSYPMFKNTIEVELVDAADVDIVLK